MKKLCILCESPFFSKYSYKLTNRILNIVIFYTIHPSKAHPHVLHLNIHYEHIVPNISLLPLD